MVRLWGHLSRLRTDFIEDSKRGERVRERFKSFRATYLLRRGSPEAYLAAAVLVFLATLVRWGLGFITENAFVFASYYPAVLFATYVGGARVGIFAAALSSVVAWWAFLPPYFVFFPVSVAEVIKMLAFLFASALIIWGADSYRTLAN